MRGFYGNFHVVPEIRIRAMSFPFVVDHQMDIDRAFGGANSRRRERVKSHAFQVNHDMRTYMRQFPMDFRNRSL